MAKQKIVLKVAMTDNKSREKAIDIVIRFYGVDSVQLGQGADKDQITIFGEEIDLLELLKSLRKYFRRADLISVGPVEEKKEEKAAATDLVHEKEKTVVFAARQSKGTVPLNVYPYPYGTIPGVSIYDVFLSFREEDTGNNFTDFLYHALAKVGLRTFRFRGDPETKIRDEMMSEVEAAIQLSRAWIIVISEKYATSSRCLKELHLILEIQKKDNDRIVLPIFYRVNPSHIRTLPGKLRRIANFNGEVAVGPESKFIQKIVAETGTRLGQKAASNDLVGHINSWLRNRSSDVVDILTIHGVGGIGKTTLAKYIYHSNVGLPFEGRSFLEDIGLHSTSRPDYILELQNKLLGDIGIGSPTITDVKKGMGEIQKALRAKKVLLVMDDVNDVDQLNSLLGKVGFHKGTKVIITTNDKSLPLKSVVFNPNNVPSNHEERQLERLSEKASLELLCKHAFKSDFPDQTYEELSKKVTDYCGGNPLALEVLGGSLYQYGRVVWDEKVRVLSKEPTIQKALQLSFELLEYPSDKESFKHIACFFVGEERNYVETILDACGVHPSSTIPSLINKCLLTIDPRSNKLKMHQLVRAMGRDMVHQESPEKPGERSRLWCHDESFDVLRQGKGSAKIKGLILDMMMLNQENQQNAREVDLKTDAFKQMEKLELLKLNLVIFKGPYRKFPKSLKWLCWHRFPLESIPRDFKMENLVVLDMSFSKLKRWETPGRPGALKIKKLFLRSCYLLESLSSLPCTITFLDVWGCRSLKKVTFQSDINEPVLRQVEISHCLQLTEVQGFFKAESVKEVEEKVLTNLGWSGDGFVRNLETMILERDLTMTRTPSWKNVPAEVMYEFGIFSTWFQGEKIPHRLIVREKKKGPSISFTIPSSPMKNRIQGLNVCSAHTVPYKLLHKSSKRVKIINTTKKLAWIYEARGWDVESEVPPGEVSKDMVLLSHWRFGDKLEAGDEVTVTIGKDRDGDITMSDNYNTEVIKEVGIGFVYSKDGGEAYCEEVTISDDYNTEVIEEVDNSLVYSSDDVKKEEKVHDPLEYYNDKCWKHVIGGDLSPFQSAKGEYHLISQRPPNVWSEVVKKTSILPND